MILKEDILGWTTSTNNKLLEVNSVHILSIPGLSDVRACNNQELGQNENINTIGDHSKWVPLNHALPTVQEIGRLVPVLQD